MLCDFDFGICSRDQRHQGGESVSAGDPEAHHRAGAGRQGRQVRGGDNRQCGCDVAFSKDNTIAAPVSPRDCA